ncbi:MAG TPA: SpoIIE family protein phosphatase [Firmicutes bacterium]|nr:SpoIIE family protein phosphatase [Bacillota bacterium]
MGRLQLLSVEQNRRIRGLCLWTLQLALPADVPWALVAAGLFLANGAVFGELLPLGIPYIAALRASGPREGVALPAAAVMLSIIWTVGFWAAVPYIIPILVLSLATIKSARSGTAKQIWLLAALTAFAGKTVLALLMRPTVGILLSGVTEAVVGALAYALLYPLLDGQAERDLAYRETQWLLVILAATAAFDGVLWGISIRLFLSFFLIAGAARLGALPLAVLMGSGLGLAGLLLGEPGEYVVLAVLCASLTGVLGGMKFGLILGPALGALLSRGGLIDGATVKLAAAGLAAGAGASIIPARYLRHLARIIPGTPSFHQRQASYTERLREIMSERMSHQLTVFEELAQTLKDCHEQILATQVQAMADVIRTMSKEFSPGVRLTGNVEDQILRAFPDADFRSVTALYTSDGFEVSGQRARCCSDQKFCTEVARLCSQLNGKQYAVISRRCVPSRMMCGFTVGPSPKYLLQVETAMRARSGVSGDNEMVFPLSKSKIAVVLSDGMGVGARAHMESQVAIRLLQRMITAGYNVEVAISLVNKVLLLRSQDEIFVTIDLVVVDLHTGRLDFVKIGAAPSFIKRGREVEIIHNQCLPVGILSQVDVETDRRILKEGEVLIMVTDGVLEARRHLERKEEWVSRMLQRIDHSQDLKELAQQVLSRSIAAAHGRVEDDMMVVAVKLARVVEEIEAYRRIS